MTFQNSDFWFFWDTLLIIDVGKGANQDGESVTINELTITKMPSKIEVSPYTSNQHVITALKPTMLQSQVHK